MGRILKWLLYALGGLIAALVLFVGIVLLVVDPNDYRGQIEQIVERQTGRALTIEGDLDLTFFPRFGIEVGSTRLAEAGGFGDEPFLQVERVQLAVQVLPLLSGELVLDTIILEQPRIRLVRLEDGRANWETLAPPAEQGSAPAEQPQQPQQPQGNGGPAVPAILRDARLAGFVIRDAHVTYIDRQADVEATLDPFNLTLEDVRLGGSVPLAAGWQASLAGGPAVQGELLAVLEIAEDLSRARASGIDLQVTVSGDAIPGGSQRVSLGGDLEADLEQGVFRLAGLTLNAAGAELNGEAEARLTEAGPSVTGRMTLPEVSPRDILSELAIEPPPTRDDSVLTAFEAEGRFQFADGRLVLEDLSARLDDSSLAGRVVVRDFAAPTVDFAFQLDGINVDRYLPPPSEQESAEPVADSGQESPQQTEGGGLPLEPLRSLELNGQLQVGSLTVAGAEASDINMTITARDGRIRVHPLTALLYGGHYGGDVRLDVTGDTPVISLGEALVGIQAQPLLTDVAGFGKLLGEGDFSIDAQARGADAESILKSLAGQASFSFSDGAIKGINVAQMIRRGMATLRGQSADATAAPEQTDFSALSGTLTFDGGRVHNDDLKISTPLLRIGGEGSANLLRQTLDYWLTVNVVATLEGQGGASLEQLRGVPIPLHISGSFASPDIDLALGEAMRNAVDQRIEEKREQVEQKLQEEIEEELGDKLPEGFKGLFGE